MQKLASVLHHTELKALPKPTIKQLCYFLDNLSSYWREIGLHLNFFTSQLNGIAKDFKINSRCLIKLFDIWIESDIDCSWYTIIKILEKMDEKRLAFNILNYMLDFSRSESFKFMDYCKSIVPSKDFCYIETKRYFETDVLARTTIDKIYKVAIFRCLEPQQDKWYEMGIAMGISREKLSLIEEKHDYSSTALLTVIEMVIEKFTFTFCWKKIIDDLRAANLNSVAKAVERLALDKCNLSTYEMTILDHYKKEDFISDKSNKKEEEEKQKIQECTNKIRKKLHLTDDHVTDEDILEKLSKLVIVQKLNPSDLKEVVGSVEDISNFSSKRAILLINHAKELKDDLKMAENVRGKLMVNKDQLELDKGRLERRSKDISKKIDQLSPTINEDEKSQLSELESMNKEALQELEEVCKKLHECILKLELSNANYYAINDELTECQVKLHECEYLLKTSLSTVAELKSPLKVSSKFKEEITKILMGIEDTNKEIKDTQMVLTDAIKKHPYPHALEEADAFRCYATGEGLVVAKVGEEATVKLQANSLLGKPSEAKEIECKIVSKLTGESVMGRVKSQMSEFLYEISYWPKVKGRHDLHITVRGKHVRASPFYNVAVRSFITNFNKPLKSWASIERPTYVAASQQGEMVVHQFKGSESIVSIPERNLCHNIDRCLGLAVSDEIFWAMNTGNYIVIKRLYGGTKTVCNSLSDMRISIAFNAYNSKIYVLIINLEEIKFFDSNFKDDEREDDKRKFDCCSSPQSIACDSATGKVYVLGEMSKIFVYTAEGQLVRHMQIGLRCDSSWYSIAVDREGNVYVSCKNDDNVTVYDATGERCNTGKFDSPQGLAVDDCGVVYVCEYKGNRVLAF